MLAEYGRSVVLQNPGINPERAAEIVKIGHAITRHDPLRDK